MSNPIFKLTFSVAFFIAFTYHSAISQALTNFPEQDCVNAIPICQNIYVQANAYIGEGTIVDEVNSSITCLGGEQNSVWYRYKATTSGTLSFTLTPINPSNDYDWAVFNITNATCADTYNDTALVESCSFSPIPGPTGPNGGVDPPCKPVIDVTVGEMFVIIVTIFSNSNQSGYTLDFSASTTNYFCDLDITENTNASVLIYPNPSDGAFTISLDKVHQEVNIGIYAMDGKLVHQQQVYNTSNLFFEPVLASGVYYVQVKIDNQFITKKVIIN